MHFLATIFQRAGAGSGANGGSLAHSRVRIVLAVLLALNGVLLVLVLLPPGRSPLQREADLNRKLADYKETLNTVQQMRDLRSKVQSAIQNNQQFSQQHFLQRKAAFSAMLADLEQIATQNHVKTSNISYRLQEEDKQPGFQDVIVVMQIEGQYTDLVQFISRLEKSELFWIIDSMSLAPSGGRDLRVNLQMGTLAVFS